MSKEARLFSALLTALAVLSTGASYRTQNFVVTTNSPQLAQEICEKAENDRRELAIEWLGSELPAWHQPCPITVHCAPNMGAGGVTQFMFDRGRPFGWTMTIQGSRERLLDSVLPHEVTHTIFATHFGQPLPRWADEGACTTVEHTSERSKQERLLIEFLTTDRGIAFNRMFAMKEYPRDVLPLYAQGYSLARYLIAQGGKQKFVQYVGDGMKSGNWPAATQKNYGFKDLSQLQVTWLDWVRRGSPLGDPSQDGQLLVSNSATPSPTQAVVPATATAPAQAAPLGVAAARTVPVEPPPVQQAALNQVASTQPAGSWYARQRDRLSEIPYEEQPSTQPAGELAAASVPSGVLARGGGYSPGSIGPEEPAVSSLSRMQPPGRPEQQVLEWSSQNQAMTVPSQPALGYLDAAIRAGTMRR